MDDGGLGIRNWGGYYDHQPAIKGLGLNLMPTVAAAARDTKPLLSNGAFLHRDCGIPDHPVPMEYIRDSWMHHRENNRLLHVLPLNHNYPAVPDPQATGNPHTLKMLQPSEPALKDEKDLAMDEPGTGKDAPVKKRSRGARTDKAPKPKKPKKAPAPEDEMANKSSVPRAKGVKRSAGVVINGIDLDIAGLPTPVCSCTGTPQPCYRWGIGGWQSACCTTSISMYPLPMSTKKRSARIAGRKMSLGAFKKVLEKLAGGGFNLSNSIDLRTYWAKHGTNKYVTIR
uniref:GAGA-binding transcriptional activator n=1 Tax=Anthurium amnicola TaxID=1678845 RepID=A0A1D1XQG7_9ARAE